MNQVTPLATLLDDLGSGKQRATELLESCFTQIDLRDNASAQVYTRRFDQSARAEAEAADHLRTAGLSGGQLAGLPAPGAGRIRQPGMP